MDLELNPWLLLRCKHSKTFVNTKAILEFQS